VTRLLSAFVLALLLAVAPLLAQGEKPTGQQQYATTIFELGQCHAKLGALEQVDARREAGLLFDAAGAKQRIEAANPEYTLDPVTFKIALKGKK